jgi:hypothetical protein
MELSTSREENMLINAMIYGANRKSITGILYGDSNDFSESSTHIHLKGISAKESCTNEMMCDVFNIKNTIYSVRKKIADKYETFYAEYETLNSLMKKFKITDANIFRNFIHDVFKVVHELIMYYNTLVIHPEDIDKTAIAHTIILMDHVTTPYATCDYITYRYADQLIDDFLISLINTKVVKELSKESSLCISCDTKYERFLNLIKYLISEDDGVMKITQLLRSSNDNNDKAKEIIKKIYEL